MALDRDVRTPLRRQLEIAIRDAIRTGRLRPGVRLPSSRDLARGLGVSRGVVVDAYDALGAQGFLVLRDRAVPLVAPSGGMPAVAREVEEPVVPSCIFDFTATTPDVSLFGRRAWLRAFEQALRAAPDADLDYGDPRGALDARRVLADYLGRVRGVVASPAAITVVQGFSQAIDIGFRLLAASGARRVGFEDPSLDEQWETARRAGLQPVPIPVDMDGIRVDELRAIDPDAVVVTPAHQFPTGSVLAPARRRALLDWAADRGALVIEDDYDAEFRYDRTPVGTLQGLDPAHVLYVGTVSKTLAPSLRLGWTVVPPRLRDRFVEGKLYADGGSPTLDQLALAHLFTSGAYEQEVRRARAVYRKRRDTLLDALGSSLPECRVVGIAAGLHVLLRLPPGSDEAAVVAAAEGRRLRVRALGDFRLGDASFDAALVLGYARLSQPAIAPAVRELAAAVSAAS
ncbi:MocR-like pyridoxine biosynthesis transcription factor PdxR [Nonomuraea turcica]|uniref:MocR-like pyridoxine biosynthesis transcription factor PdxR n=1 Tax=Nonomuraea sp. G32 TaxID=3067274 RepID=UPI00273C1F7E|nr:PLP-dependent aminotransferase family protein [Nonomuraea sp. G32]MDP4506958.1 PLP-dependent aminotransferase family protein [Nonomuraea sp. G32]